MISTTRTPGALTVGPLRPVILKLAAPAVAMMACHFCFNLIDAMWVGRLIGPAALAAVSTAGFYVWVLLSLGEMVEVGLIAVAARRHGEGLPEAAARAAGAAVLYALAAGTVVSLVGLALRDGLFHLMGVPREVATLGRDYLDTWLLGGPLVFGFFAIEATFRASGDTRTPFLLLMASVVLSVGLDPLLRVRALGLRPRGAEPWRAPGGTRPSGGADDGGLLSGGHDDHGGCLPHDPRDPRRPVHIRRRGDRGRQPVSARDRVRADRPDVRDHPGGRARRRGLHAVAPAREHCPDAAACAPRRVVVGGHRPRRHLARPLGHGDRARDRHGDLLAQRRVAPRNRLTTDGHAHHAPHRLRRRRQLRGRGQGRAAVAGARRRPGRHHAPGAAGRRASGTVHPVARLASVPTGERAPRGRGPGRRHRPPRAGRLDGGTLLRRPGQRLAVVSAG